MSPEITTKMQPEFWFAHGLLSMKSGGKAAVLTFSQKCKNPR
jgi:hypothetical protein